MGMRRQEQGIRNREHSLPEPIILSRPVPEYSGEAKNLKLDAEILRCAQDDMSST